MFKLLLSLVCVLALCVPAHACNVGASVVVGTQAVAVQAPAYVAAPQAVAVAALQAVYAAPQAVLVQQPAFALAAPVFAVQPYSGGFRTFGGNVYASNFRVNRFGQIVAVNVGRRGFVNVNAGNVAVAVGNGLPLGKLNVPRGASFATVDRFGNVHQKVKGQPFRNAFR